MSDASATPAVPDFEAVDPGSPVARECMDRYFAELDERFDIGFDPGPLVESDLAELRPPYGTFLVARGLVAPGEGGEALAGGGVRPYDGTAEIKRMWVSPSARGRGLGRRLLGALEEEARRLGHTVVRLDTRGDVLTEAVALYLRCGYERIERYNDNPYATHFFAKVLE
ncbi:MAG: GNAT family N-acetyltransferase [Nocardioides sp.]|uniref:GNAT family N-acetyltransferase n=1 Tax=Nocardioides sp. TaxID=35761 RepID=UPI0039E40F3E